MQAPKPAVVEAKQAEFEEELHEALCDTIPKMQAACGAIHVLLFGSPSFKEPVLTPAQISEAQNKLSVSDHILRRPWQNTITLRVPIRG